VTGVSDVCSSDLCNPGVSCVERWVYERTVDDRNFRGPKIRGQPLKKSIVRKRMSSVSCIINMTC